MNSPLGFNGKDEVIQIVLPIHLTRCLVPAFDGALFSQEWKDSLWARYYTGARHLAAARQQFKRGATQIKITAGGGVTSDFDPIDTVQFTSAELRAIVQAAKDWGTYTCAHAYSRPPSNAAVTFLPMTAGNPKELAISPFMAGVACGIFCPATGPA